MRTGEAGIGVELVLLTAAAIFLLAVAAINVGCLLLARVLDRRRIGRRAALGADRRRIALQLFAEALAIVVAGGLAGVLADRYLLTGFSQPRRSRFPAT